MIFYNCTCGVGNGVREDFSRCRCNDAYYISLINRIKDTKVRCKVKKILLGSNVQ